jgi:hypothetical protein
MNPKLPGGCRPLGREGDRRPHQGRDAGVPGLLHSDGTLASRPITVTSYTLSASPAGS